jgi:hypothetical protein
LNHGIRCAASDLCELTITGIGSLGTSATGDCAAIGGNTSEAVGTINIQGGTISAIGGIDGAAGIGSGPVASGGTINISGGIIAAEGNMGGAGIGGGWEAAGLEITISGGTIKSAVGSLNAAGIGKGSGGSEGTTKITGGSIKASSIVPDPTLDGVSSIVYKNTLTVPEDFEDSLVTGYYNPNYQYEINDVYADASHQLYFYLPATSSAELLAVGFLDPVKDSEEYYGATNTRAAANTNTQTLLHLQLPTPLANIDYENEKLIDLNQSVNYDISIAQQLEPESFSLKPLSAALSNGAGEIPIDESWMGESIDIFQTRIAIPYGDSDTQNLGISPRPDATPELKALVSSISESQGAKGKVSGIKVGMAYSTNPNAAPSSWTTVDSEDDLLLAPGTYYFRVISDGLSFATEYVTVVIPGFPAPVAPDSPLDLAKTGLNLYLAYLLVLLLLVAGCVSPARTVIPAKAGI